MEITLGRKKIQNHELLDLKEAQKQFKININTNNDFSTIIIYDIYAPSVNNPTKSPYLHYLNVNIPKNNVNDGNILMTYVPPSPPPNSGNHKYIIELYRQNGRINPSVPSSRPNFPVEKFVNDNHLFLTEKNDFSVIPN